MKCLEKFNITVDLMESLGFKLSKDSYDKDSTFLEFSSYHPVSRNHVIKGHNSYLGNAQRIVYFRHDGCKDFMYLVIKCDGATRTLFNGVIQNDEDLKTIIRLID